VPHRCCNRNQIWLFCLALILLLVSCKTSPSPTLNGQPEIKFQTITFENGNAPITLNLAYRPNTAFRHPVILMLGSIPDGKPPAWSTNLVAEGYMLAAFTAAYPPDPDPARRPQWLFFDQRFAHSYILGGHRAVSDTKPVINYLVGRGDVHPDKIGWLGSSSTGIPGLSVVTQGPHLAAIVAFVSTGAYRQWFDTWHTNNLWRGTTSELWPETLELLRLYDPLLHVEHLFPTAVLMVSGGEDKVVDPRTARTFADAARPFYQADPDRLRLVIYEGFGHNLPLDVVQQHAEHWFHLYLNPTNAPPKSLTTPDNLKASVIRSQINATDHRQIIGADTSTKAN
jgi:dienelactone hydrolase